MKKRFFLNALFLLAVTLASAQAASLRFSIPTGENGVGKQQMAQTLQKIFDVVKQKTTVELILDPVYAYTISKQKGIPGHLIRLAEYVSRLKANKTDIVGITAEEYFTNPSLKNLVDPGFTWSVSQQKYGNECLYVNADGPIKSVKDLKGKNITGLTSYLTVRRLLFDNRVNVPLAKFFGKFSFIDDPMQQYQALVDGKVDVFHDTFQGWYFYKSQKPAFKKVKPLVCLKNQPLVFFALRKGADHAVADKVLNYLTIAHKDPAMGAARWFFLAFNGSFFKFGMEYLADYAKFYQDAEKRGWVAEAKKWHAQDSPGYFKAWLKNG